MVRFYIGQKVKFKDNSSDIEFTVRSVDDIKNGGVVVISYTHNGEVRRKEYAQKDLEILTSTPTD